MCKEGSDPKTSVAITITEDYLDKWQMARFLFLKSNALV